MDDQAKAGDAGEKPRGIFGRVFGGGGKRYKAAKMGKQLEMYYNEKLKCWVIPGEEEAKEKEMAELTAPPPKSISTASMAPSSQEDAGSAAGNGGGGSKPPSGGPPIYGGARGTSRYASTSSFSINAAVNGAAAPSLMAGLNPPSAFGLPGGASGGGIAPAVFKPMVPAAVQPENDENEVEATSPAAGAVAADTEMINTSQQQQQQQEEDADIAAVGTTDPQYDNNQYYNGLANQQQDQDQPTSNPIDPVILEVLSFWSYYRNCGYDPDAMAEWVDQNYEPEYTGINYEEMLLDPQIAAAVEQHISENRNPDAPHTASDAVHLGGGSLDYNNNNESNLAAGGVAGNTTSLENELVAEAAGEYLDEHRQQLQHGGDQYNHDDNNGGIASGTRLVEPPPPEIHHHHLPGAESGWSGFDEGLEVEGGGALGSVENEHAVAAADHAGGGIDDSAQYMHYDQYSQYHTTDQYQVESTNITEATMGGVPTAGVAAGADGEDRSGDYGATVAVDTHQPLEEDQWGYTTPAGPSPARGAGGHHGGVPRFPLPGVDNSSLNDASTTEVVNGGGGGAAGVGSVEIHPIFSPGQLAADLGVPREAVTMSALFAAEAASVGTLSSRNSEDGWSDHGGDLGILPGGGDVIDGVVESCAAPAAGGFSNKEEAGAALVEEIPPPLSLQPPVDRTASSASQIDVVGPWEAAAAAIEASSAEVPPPPPALPAPVEMESKSTQADATLDTVGTIDNNSNVEYQASLLELESLREQLTAATAAAETAALELGRSQEEAAVHSAILAEVMGVRDAAVNEKQALEEQIETLKNEVVEMSEEVSSLKKQCTALETAAAEQARSFTEAESKVASLEDERDALAAQLAEAQAQDATAAATAGEVAVLQAELDEAKEALEARENECEDLKAALELKDDAITELRAQEIRANEAKNKEIAEISSSFESQLVSLRGELSAAREALAAAEESASENIAAALEDVGERIQIAVNEAIEEKNSEFEQRETAWREEVKALRTQLTTFEASIMEKESESMDLQAQLTSQSAQFEANLAAAVAAATTEVAASKDAELDAAQTRIKNLEKKFALAKKKIAGQMSEHEQLTAEIQSLKQQLEEAVAIIRSSSHNESELAEMSQALSDAAAAQEALTTEASALQSRLEQLQATKEEEIQALANDNSQLVQMIGERDALIESLSGEIEALGEQLATLTASFEAEKAIVGANTQNDALIQQLQSELEAAKEDISQWAAVAEEADARCTAAEEALAAEEAAREEASAAVVGMQEEVAALQQALASTEAQCNELAAMQEFAAASGAGRGGAFSGNDGTINSEEVVALRQRLSEVESELIRANETLRALDRGGFEDAVDEAEDLRNRLAAASQVAAAKEEELLKYKKQLVKAKKLRNADSEKIAALEQTIALSGSGGGDAAAPTDTAAAAATNADESSSSSEIVASLREELSSLQEQLTAMRAVSAETDEGLNTALSALGTEELKVARLAELLIERGMEEKVVEEELNAVEEMVIMDEEEQ